MTAFSLTPPRSTKLLAHDDQQSLSIIHTVLPEPRRKRLWMVAGGKRQISSTALVLSALGITFGMVIGFALPLASRHQTNDHSYAQQTIVVEDPVASLVAVPPITVPDKSKDAELARLRARNHRLEVMVANLRRQASAVSEDQ